MEETGKLPDYEPVMGEVSEAWRLLLSVHPKINGVMQVTLLSAANAVTKEVIGLRGYTHNLSQENFDLLSKVEDLRTSLLISETRIDSLKTDHKQEIRDLTVRLEAEKEVSIALKMALDLIEKTVLVMEKSLQKKE